MLCSPRTPDKIRTTSNTPTQHRPEDPRRWGQLAPLRDVHRQIRRPSVRGHNCPICPSFSPECGRSPACAGTASSWASRVRHFGRTPRVRGTTLSGPPRPTLRWEDPRVCGDDAAANLSSLTAPGRSPRARGRPAPRPSHQRPRRKIPACAGTTGAATRPPGSGAEDPRVRGDDAVRRKDRAARVGRSPRARGRHLLIRQFTASLGRFESVRFTGTRILHRPASPLVYTSVFVIRPRWRAEPMPAARTRARSMCAQA
jgi:hypothetical protein